MAKVYIYGDMDSYSAVDFLKSLDDIPSAEEELQVRVCCNGGEPTAMWAMLSNLKDTPNPKKGMVDGKAYSGGAFALCYMDDVEAIDTSEFLFHRAAYPAYYESNAEWFDDATRGNLDRVNKNLRKAMEAKMDIPMFEQITGCTLNQLFSMEDRKDVFLTAQQAKKCGLINRIVQLTPKRKSEIETKLVDIMSTRSGVKMAALHTEESQNQKPNKMEIKSLLDLKANYPQFYAEAVKEGADAEFTRVNSFNVFRGVDAKAVDAAIKERKPFTTDFQSEMLLKAANPKALKALEDDAAPAVVTEEAGTPETPEAKAKAEALAKFEESVDKAYADRNGKPAKK